ncbi:MAG TPA: VCBS repeat-containing protein [Steroidobacter sp.]|uniref:FG-GAP repeat domain-containing protein n=1 Tax=Steroidobacter sp. TaxID=1978227 RepID=UPI002EDB27B4
MKKIAMLVVMISAGLGAATALGATDWSTEDYDLYPGDFDGDGKTDLLYVAKDAARTSGIVRSDGSGPNIPFQSWPSNFLGIPWHSNLYTVVVADFNGDGTGQSGVPADP